MLLTCLSLQATIVGPYSPDATTLHLWHLDETGAPAVDSAPGGTNLATLGGGAVLGTTSFNGFGTALDTLAGTGAYLSARPLLNGVGDEIQMTYANTNTGAFTYEAVLRVDFDPATFFRGNVPLYLITGENETGSRPWQFRIHNNNVNGGPLRLEFFNIGAGGSVVANLPTTGPDAIAQGNWYHAAVTFSGAVAGGQVRLYWTRIDSSRVQATQIGVGTLGNLNPLASASFDFCIGNVGRTTPNGNWIGLIDEVRMSSVARSATEMMFVPPTNVVIITQPADQTIAIGQVASFSVSAVSSITPLSYQWRHAGTNLSGVTQSSYTIPSAQFIHAGAYDVIVTNAVSVTNSTVAMLTVRTPLNLTWLGTASANWNTTDINWDSNADLVADTAYTSGDNVLFNNSGIGNPIVSLADAFTPSSVTVNADLGNDYLLTTTGSGTIAISAGLTKQGANRLVLDTDNTYAGTTLISAGMIQVGNAGARGSLGTGPVTNNAELLFDRTGTLTMTNPLAGGGSMTKSNTLSLRLLGNNTFSGPITLGRGNLTVGASGLAGSISVTLYGKDAAGTTLTLRDGATVGTSVNLTCNPVDVNNRTGLVNEDGTNIFNGNILLSGAGPMQVNVGAGALEVNGPISGASFTDVINFRGVGTNNILRSQFNLPNGGLQKDDPGTWLLDSTGNIFPYLRMLAGTLKLGNGSALPASSFVRTDGGTLDLAGFNQTVAGLANYRATPVTTIANSSTTSDSRLNVVTAPADPPWVSGCIIANSTAGGTRTLSLTLAGGATLVFTNVNTFSGDTTINAGTLALSGSGALANSTPISMATGTTLDASARTNATLTLNATQTLKGNGAFNVLGNLVNNGTIELKLNKSGATLTGDTVNGVTALTYGGTLKVNLTASPALSTSDSFKFLYAGSYGGAFVKIIPSVPVFGLAWDTSTLTTDGTLRIKPGPNTTPTNIVAVVVNGGSTLQLSWPADYQGWTLQVQTNAVNVGLSTNWVNVPNSAQTNQVFLPITPANGCVFHRLVYP